MRIQSLPILCAVLIGLTGAATCAAQDYDDRSYEQSQYSSQDEHSYSHHDDYDRRGYGYWSDEQIHDAVHRALERQMGWRANRIQVEVTDRNVYLSGWVRSMRDHDYAHDIAHNVRGVRAVYHDNLEVGRRDRY